MTGYRTPIWIIYEWYVRPNISTLSCIATGSAASPATPDSRRRASPTGWMKSTIPPSDKAWPCWKNQPNPRQQATGKPACFNAPSR